MTRRFPDNVKPCADCGKPFPKPADMDRRVWLFQPMCLACEPARLKARIKERIVVDERGCWIWQGSTARMGYGQMTVHNAPRALHVLTFQLYFGPVPEGKEVCHTCDVRACCNPEHLFVGTHLENIQDMWDKGRGVNPPTRTGEEHPLATLSDADCDAIRALRAARVKQRDVAKRFGVSQSTVWRITHRIVRAQGSRVVHHKRTGTE